LVILNVCGGFIYDLNSKKMELKIYAKEWCEKNDLEIKDEEQARWVYRMMDWFAMSTLTQVNKNNDIHSVRLIKCENCNGKGYHKEGKYHEDCMKCRGSGTI